MKIPDLEKAYNDKTAWKYFEGENENETIYVYARCHCGRYLKKGQVLMNKAGDVKTKGWACKKHGEIEPLIDRA